MTDADFLHNPYDFREFFHAVGGFTGERALRTSVAERTESEVPAELIDDDNSCITAEPLPVAAFVDGVQASLIVTHREHRPVYLNYVAAGAMGRDSRGARPVGLRESLTLVCSSLDRAWADDVRMAIPVDELPVESPPDIERAAGKVLGNTRDLMERRLVEDLVAQGVHPIAVDGSLMGRPFQAELVGIVKSTNRKYLADERCLYRLPQGWRSPRFKIPAGTAGSPMDRYSCYVRMADASNRAWNHGLIRVETFDPEILDAMAARCLSERQNAASGDPRWDRHMASVRAVEEFLRARRPVVFSL